MERCVFNVEEKVPKSEWKGDKRGGRTEMERWFTAPRSSSLLFIFNQPPLSSPAETRCVTASAEEVGTTRSSWSPAERCLRLTGIQLLLFFVLIWPGTWMRLFSKRFTIKCQNSNMYLCEEKCACFISSGSTCFRKLNFSDFQKLRLCREVTLGRLIVRVVTHCSCFWSAALRTTGELRAAYYTTSRS